MSDDNEAKVLQALGRQTRQDLLIDLVFAERRLIPLKTKAAQPIPEVHDGVLIARRLTGSFRSYDVSRALPRRSLRHLSMAASLRTGKGTRLPELAYRLQSDACRDHKAGTISSDGNHNLAEMLV